MSAHTPSFLALQEAKQNEREAWQTEVARRFAEYEKQNGRISRATEFHERATGVKPKPPLHILAIGDSWFDYPLNGNLLLPPFDFGIVSENNLKAMGNPPPVILSLAKFGQASTAVLSYENQENYIKAMQGGLDAILISAGGDDMAGDQFAIYVDYGGVAGLDAVRFRGVLDSVKASYVDFFALRQMFAPNVPIFGHCYDYAIPNGTPAGIFGGPWLQPSLNFALYNLANGTKVVRNAIDGFYQMLDTELGGNNFFVVDTRNTVAANNSFPNGWANELHPFADGFHALAQKFLAVLQTHFPGRI
jgi:hypothetical protein